ncbi:NAD(P)-dependent oxidoreductase [Desulfovibrio sp. OttesenSCG-928-F20]|nr:NAD(P)-dependent oxidoreductase [Desulfovibrio sp. OttesenSCG-928-F20]
MNIAYIGLGLMGRPCALNLIKAGHTLHVWARRPEAADALLKAGAKWHNSIASCAASSEILFLNLTNTDDVEKVLFGPGGVVESKQRGLTVVDMSTISAIATRAMNERLKEFDMELVDAPVSGGTIGAEQGTLTIMVGASQESFARLKPVLESMGKNVTRIGECGAGQVAKSCNQIVITGAIAAVAEAIRFAEAAQVDPKAVRQALMGGFASSRVLELHGLRMIEDNYAPGFKSALHLKDMNIVKEIAAELGMAMPLAKLGVELLEQTVEAGFAEMDSSAMYKVTT